MLARGSVKRKYGYMWSVVWEIRTRYEYVLQLFHQSLMNLQNGVIMKPNGTNQSFKVYGFLYSVSCDIPARSVLMNMNQYIMSFAVQNVYKLAKTDELQLEAISECFHIKRPIQLGQGEMHMV